MIRFTVIKAKSWLRYVLLPLLTGLISVAALPALAEHSAARFMEQAQKRCLLPFENVLPADRTGMILSTNTPITEPAFSARSTNWKTSDGLYFLSMTSDLLLDQCAFGFLADNLRRNAEKHFEVRQHFLDYIKKHLVMDRYSLVDRSEENGNLEVKYESTIWREPRIEIVFVSEPVAGLLHILVQEIDKEA